LVCEDLNPTHSTRRLLQMNDNTNEAGVSNGKPELIGIDEGESGAPLLCSGFWIAPWGRNLAIESCLKVGSRLCDSYSV
jgi:hypothetical protein